MSFGFLRYTQPPPSNILDAMIETMVLMSMADGNVDEEEVKSLAGITAKFMEQNPQYGSMTVEQLLMKCDGFVKQAAQQGLQARLSSISATLGNPENRGLAVFFALVISAADGHLDSAERQMLDALQAAFGFSKEEMSSIIDAFLSAIKSG